MASVLQVAPLRDFGFGGINTRDPISELPPADLSDANNFYVDESGILSVRSGFKYTHTPLVASDSYVQAHKHVLSDGSEVIVLAKSDKTVWATWDGGVNFYQLTYPGGYATPATADWKFVSFNGKLCAFQRDSIPLKITLTSSAGTAAFSTIVAAASGGGVPAILNGNTVLSAWGRLWVADTSTDKVGIWISKTLDETTSYFYLELSKVFKDGDEIIALEAFQDTLVIFGNDQIVLYQNPDLLDSTASANQMVLREVFIGYGAIGRDAVINTGDDLIFFHSSGIHSLSRAIAAGYQPTTAISGRYNNTLLKLVKAETERSIKMMYDENRDTLWVFMGENDKIITFDKKYIDQQRAWRVFVFTSNYKIKCGVQRFDSTVFLGGLKGLFKYATNSDGTTASPVIIGAFATTGRLSLGDAPRVTALKKASITYTAGPDSEVEFQWRSDVDSGSVSSATLPTQASGYSAEYGIAQYGIDEYSSPNLTESTYSIPLNLSSRKWVFKLYCESLNSETNVLDIVLFYTNHKVY